MSTKPWY